MKDRLGPAWLVFIFGLRMRPVRWLPWGDFDEVNLRTYVKTADGKRGVWFHSLDSTDIFAVLGARILYGLTYRSANIEKSLTDQSISYESITHCIFGNIPAKLDAELKESNCSFKVARELANTCH